MDDIARQARVAKGLIYYYFHSKRGYYLAIICLLYTSPSPRD